MAYDISEEGRNQVDYARYAEGSVMRMGRGVKPLQRGRQERKTMHDGDYHRVLKAIQRARGIMTATGRNHLDIRCPICGSYNAAFVVRPGRNTGDIMAATCIMGCFTAWE